ncbi:solute carrier family 41 member 3-like isoform X1 [Dermacentor silvarum]|uniref:solute carrier family 41 member 3-like isoform X1 n=2 Tax=Dermacentor silvarum TaxID=543639 RepID=UPI001897B364|nr:solute carrier family 41 member 3-like isoform X1 [Dermacentor silvarum]
MTPGPSNAEENGGERLTPNEPPSDSKTGSPVSDSIRADKVKIREGSGVLRDGSEEGNNTTPATRHPWLQENALMGTWTPKAADEMLSLAASHCRVGFVDRPSLRPSKENDNGVAIIELPPAVMSAHGDLPAAGDVALPGSGGSSERLDVKGEEEPEKSESLCVTCAQVFLPFLLAGMGSVAASLLLDHVKGWPVYAAYRELFVLIPPLLGLNGNLEMTLVARMSTQVNLDRLNTIKSQLRQAAANMALLQCQSTVVALVACGLALAKGLARHGSGITPLYACMLCACGLAAANVASMVLGAFMTTVVLVARRCGLNPDNVAAPIAASLGDLTTLTLLSTISSRLLIWKDSPLMTPGVVVLSLLLLPLWFFLAFKHENTRSVLKVGWPPILAAVMVSSFGGYILDFSVVRFEGIALHLSAVNAVGGNLAAIYCCRLSTFLSRRVELGVLPPEDASRCANPLVLFAGASEVGRVARILLLVVIPGQLIFLTATDLLRYGSFNVTPLFGFLYVLVALVQVAILLFLSRSLVYWLWWWRVDPDNAAIPFITAAGDFTGTGLLTVAFFALESVGDPAVAG